MEFNPFKIASLETIYLRNQGQSDIKQKDYKKRRAFQKKADGGCHKECKGNIKMTSYWLVLVKQAFIARVQHFQSISLPTIIEIFLSYKAKEGLTKNRKLTKKRKLTKNRKLTKHQKLTKTENWLKTENWDIKHGDPKSSWKIDFLFKTCLSTLYIMHESINFPNKSSGLQEAKHLCHCHLTWIFMWVCLLPHEYLF